MERDFSIMAAVKMDKALVWKLSQGLGWFSVGLGLAEAIAPDAVARVIGMDEKPEYRPLLRVFGLREIASGVGLLTSGRMSGWLWGRVAGDAMDLAVLGFASESKRANRTRLAVAAFDVAGVAALDFLTAKQTD